MNKLSRIIVVASIIKKKNYDEEIFHIELCLHPYLKYYSQAKSKLNVSHYRSNKIILLLKNHTLKLSISFSCLEAKCIGKNKDSIDCRSTTRPKHDSIISIPPQRYVFSKIHDLYSTQILPS